jgi:hypothetical protein
MWEAHIKTEYLLRKKLRDYKAFLISGYRPEKEMLINLQAKGKKRKYFPIEKRVLSSIHSHIKSIGVSKKEFLNTKINAFNVKNLFESLQKAEAYYFGYGVASHGIHGTWYDLSVNHLEKAGNRYKPNLSFKEIGFGYLILPCLLLCNQPNLIIEYFNLQRKRILDQISKNIEDHLHDLNDLYELKVRNG